MAWWNWTESGWHALAAINSPIEFSPDVGAIVFLHEDSHSKKMDSLEFRLSWFEMLVDVRAMALEGPVTRGWWTRHMMPVTSARFLGTLVRLCTVDGSKKYETLGRLGVASGMNALGVSGSIRLARAAQAIGLGDRLNGAIEWYLRRGNGGRKASGARSEKGDDAGIDAAARVFSSLNHKVGLN